MSAGDALAARIMADGRRCSLTSSILTEWAGKGTPRQREHLAAFLAEEAAARDASRRARLLKAARIPAPKDLAGYDWSPVRLPATLPRGDLESLAFLDARQDLVLAGDVGCGKTHLAAALARQAALAMRPARFATAAGLVMELRRAKTEGRLEAALAGLARFDLLVIDELGYLPIDAEGARLLFQVISQAYETQSLIITTNLPFAAWGTIFGDEHMAAAIIDRLAHHGHHIKPAGTSYRALGALMRTSPHHTPT